MALILKRTQSTAVSKARTEESIRPYFFCTFLGSFPGQLSGTLKVKDAEGNKSEFEVEANQNIEIDLLGVGKVTAYIVSQKPQEKSDGTTYLLTTIAVPNTAYIAVRQDKADRALITMERHLYKATHEEVSENAEAEE